ncbi:MAG: DUF86 domain-containing protein [candidate division NC10 bacterium]|nr:DUF86 domain-containing protein [candidate division NC10 bacterium]MDE2322921.1 DUF86 domain-containing protein [candidate division NC10 bacterium]
MDNRAKKLLFDVFVSGRSISEWCEGRSFSEYEEDRQFRRAVEREFEIIGEALNRLTQIDPTTAARIADLNRIVGFRNRIIHGYDAVDDATVWGVVEGHLPRLLVEVEALLRDAGESV